MFKTLLSLILAIVIVIVFMITVYTQIIKPVNSWVEERAGKINTVLEGGK